MKENAIHRCNNATIKINLSGFFLGGGAIPASFLFDFRQYQLYNLIIAKTLSVGFDRLWGRRMIGAF